MGKPLTSFNPAKTQVSIPSGPQAINPKGYPLPSKQSPFNPLHREGLIKTVGQQASASASRRRNPPKTEQTGSQESHDKLIRLLRVRSLGPVKKEILDLINTIKPEQLNHVTNNGYSALRLALHRNDEEIINALAIKCNVNQALNENQDTALTIAIVNDYPKEGILALIKVMTPEQLDHVTTDGNSALKLAFNHQLGKNQLGKKIIDILLLNKMLNVVNKQIDLLQNLLNKIIKETPTFLITLIALALPVMIKFEWDRQHLQTRHSECLETDNAEQKNNDLILLLTEINKKNIKQLDTLARLIRLELALLKHEYLSNIDIKEHWQNIMNSEDDTFLQCFIDSERIAEANQLFYVNPENAYPLDTVFSLKNLETYVEKNHTRFRGFSHEAVAKTVMAAGSIPVGTTIDELSKIQKELFKLAQTPPE